MANEKKNGSTAVEEKKQAPKEWSWETPHGVVNFTGLEMVRRYFCPAATDLEAVHFLAVCRYHKLNPWLKEAYLIKYDQNEAARIVIGKDFYNRRAQDFPTYRGHAGGVILQVKDASGKLTIERRTGAFHTAEEALLGGWARIWREDLAEPIEIEVQLREYDKHQANWKSMPATMIRKVALSQAWREAYPKEFEGLYDEAEIVKEPLTIEMPKSVTEAKTESPAAPSHPVKDGDAGEHAPSAAGDPLPAHPQNGAEVRKKVWALLTERASAEKTTPTKLLYKLTKKQDMAALDDAEVQGVLVQLS